MNVGQRTKLGDTGRAEGVPTIQATDVDGPGPNSSGADGTEDLDFDAEMDQAIYEVLCEAGFLPRLAS